MKPTDRARQHIARLLQFGVSQKVIAGQMQVSEGTFSRWYHQRTDSKDRPAKVPAESLDLLEDYVERLSAAFAKETQRSEAPAEKTPTTATGTAGRTFR